MAKRLRIPEKTSTFLRSLLIPLIDAEVITGYNIFQEPCIISPNFDFLYEYMHSKLRKNNKHRKELYAALGPYNPDLQENLRVLGDVIKRRAAYFIEDISWLNECKKLFDSKKNEINKEDARELLIDGEVVIGEAPQYNLKLNIYRRDFNSVNKVFHHTVFTDPINPETGQLEERLGETSKSISDAWDIPLLSVNPRMEELAALIPPAYKKIERVNILHQKVFVYILIDPNCEDKKEILETYLRQNEQPADSTPVFASITFVDYIDKIRNREHYEHFKRSLKK